MRKKGFKMLKEFLYAGLGSALIMKDRIEEEMDKLAEKGKIKKDDAKSFLESLKERGEDEESRIKDELKKMFKEVIDELGLATKEDIKALKRD